MIINSGLKDTGILQLSSFQTHSLQSLLPGSGQPRFGATSDWDVLARTSELHHSLLPIADRSSSAARADEGSRYSGLPDSLVYQHCQLNSPPPLDHADRSDEATGSACCCLDAMQLACRDQRLPMASDQAEIAKAMQVAWC
ncbi:unnamed protein product [Protopolystoma xenopodis]|uniref:Uncharacterized protein n=1 Tax=Protopolystoma xenopodis TaxID=117903 RepID=A0A3S5ABH3_9PLAT|nr:unnamed protein product [Protopolystoma xenopodis]